MQSSYLPILPAQLAKLNLKKVKYMQGHPRVYRFDAKSGRVQDHNGDPLHKAGEPITLIPLSYRTFYAEMFEYSPRLWLEVFFLNAAGQVCTLLFHGYSSQQFIQACVSLFYDECAVNEVSFEITPMLREKTLEDGKKIKYYIADFAVTTLPKNVIKKPAKVLEQCQPVYRQSTATNQQLERWLGYPEKLPKPELQQVNSGTEA